MIERQDLLDSRSPRGLEVHQLTTEEGVPSSHIYMEAQVFTPDSQRLILHRSAHPHGSDPSDPSGACARLTGGDGADIHLIRDDGTGMRDLPWGRDGNEFCQGHQCWIGRTTRGLTSTSRREPACCELIEGRGVAHVGHLGLKTPGARRNDLSRAFPQPDFHHFATDISGRRLISDAGPWAGGGSLYLADIAGDDTRPLDNITFLLNPRSSCQKTSHIHPFLSPDGKMAFFNSDESGSPQAYMVRGWES